ncbi:MAG: transposase [Burkholderiales bacterium]
MARDGFSPDAAVACKAQQRDRIERLCRYVTRPALALERLSQNAAGQVIYALKTPYRDGTTHVVFEPLDFLAKLAALVPRPRAHRVRYHGILAPHAKQRSQVIPSAGGQRRRQRKEPLADRAVVATRRADMSTAPLSWMERLKRVFAIDLSVCPQCGGRLRVIADITDPQVIKRILQHVARQQGPDPPCVA